MSVAAPRPLDVRIALRSPHVLRSEVLGGLVVGLALIPEAISLSVIAGVDPRVGLFASVTMAITISVVGGRPAMISAATGAVALVVAPVARNYGLDYLYSQFDYAEDPTRVVIDCTEAHIWDASTVAALDAVTTRYRHHGTTVEAHGLNQPSAAMYERLSGHFAD